jgi:hypothetical protein
VEDALHGVRYTLPPSGDGWQVGREGPAHVSSAGVQVEVGSFPLAKDAQASACRDSARKRIATQSVAEDDSGEARAPPARVEPPRDESTGDSPTATWDFTRGSGGSAVHSRRAYFARGADCLVLDVSSASSDDFAGRVFETASESFKVMALSPERQRESDLLAGMGFLERREPASALARFEALTQREPAFFKAHFGALMAAYELGPPAYGKGLAHGKTALSGEHDLTPEQRQLALRAVGVMQLAQDEVKGASQTLAELVVRAPELAEAQYNYACALARLGESQQALDHLRTAIRLDQDLASHAQGDDDLRSLRGSPEFQTLTRPPQSAR